MFVKRGVDQRRQQHLYLINHSMNGSAIQFYERLRFPMGTCDFWTPAPS
jgi:hypothetical protein